MKPNSIFKRKWPIILALGVLLVFLLFRFFLGQSEFLRWQLDLIRGWSLHVQVEAPPYSVELVQEPGSDFYDSFLLIRKSDGKIAFVLIDADDRKWINPKIIHQDKRIYFVRDTGNITPQTPFIDPDNNILFSGYYQRTYKLSELGFEDEQNLILDCTVNPSAK